MGTEGDENERGDRPAAEFGPPVGDFGPPLDDEGFGAPLAAAPPPPPPGALPEMGWRPAGPPSAAPAPGPVGAPAPGTSSVPGAFGTPGPFGAPVVGHAPATAPSDPPAGSTPPRGPVPPRLPADRRSAPTSVFGDAVAASPAGRDASPFGAPTAPPDSSPFGAPTAPPADATVRIGGDQVPRGGTSVFGDSPFGGSVPVNPGADRTEVIRRDRPGPRADAPSDLAPPGSRRAPEAPETVRAPLAEEPRSAEDKAWWNSPDEGGAVPKPPAEPGLSWADDPIARRLAPKTPPPMPSATKEPDKRMRWIIGGAAAAVLLVVVLVLTIGLVKRGGGDPGVTAAPIPSTVSATDCQEVAEQAVTVGNGPGDTSSGAKAILGFQYAFYVDRSGVKVREFAAPDGDISPAETIQAAIDEQIPVGATHCVKMRETSEGRYDVELREWHPDGTAIVYKQEIITANTDGKWQIRTIAAR
ncbi:hypothetical protein [Nocardia mangyaensis]|uniref:hypothetical protein n=1 Tax=Nocardia mangyaensis TaxID=2213200 RepID=UPI002676EBEA|nr:hypothetical protein [Nocardia mangyaensis]MDO3647130.1 hypothetical protein [Nocardia mangyaensis]